MNTPRFFCEFTLESGLPVTLPASVSHHIRVRRLRAGQEIVLFDGSGVEFKAILSFETSGNAIGLLKAAETVDRELPFRLTLVQGIASQDRMDWVVEKAVELGAAEFIPVTASRSVVKLSTDRAAKRTTHWQKLAVAASEQCGRNRLMQIHPPCSIEEAIKRCSSQTMLLCHLAPGGLALNHPTVLQAVRANQGASIIVGPEGGWDDFEAGKWLAAGARAISLGARVLRTETAGIAALAGLGQLLTQNH
jgi:16S rRNA (uracil1498-N3)-methyltransferase